MNLSSGLVVERALQQTLSLLSTIGGDLTSIDRLRELFGDTFNTEDAISFLERLTDGDFSVLPNIEIRSETEINNASGAYSATNNTIYLSAEFLSQNDNNISAVSSVLLEEIGHFIDWRFNIEDARGDEGFLFATLVQGNTIEENELAQIRIEDDTTTVLLDGQVLQLEQANFGDNPAFDLIGLTQLRNDPNFAGIDGSGFSVAVIDTGINFNHPLLIDNYSVGFDFINNDDNPDDVQGHGTHVSGIVGARDETLGVATDVQLIGLKVGEGRSLDGNAIIQALEWVLDNHEQYNIAAVNLSFGGGFHTSELDAIGDPRIELINRLEDEGVVVVASAGNSYKDNEFPNLAAPAIYSTLAVGSVWQDETHTLFRWSSGAVDNTTGADRIVSHSQRLDADNVIFAPGALITSTVPGGELGSLGGTSQAAPHVAGAVALLQEAAFQFGGRLLSPDEIVEILRSTADIIFDGDDEDDNVINTEISYPRINIYNAVVEIRNRFQGIAPPSGNGVGDPNGTITGAFIGPNLDGSTSHQITGIISIDGSGTQVGNTDVDIFRFEVLSPGVVTIEVDSNIDNPADFDTFLRLFDGAGNQLAFDDDGGTGLFSRLDVNLNPGTYYAGISGFNNSSYDPNLAGSGVAAATGNYSLQFNLNNNDPNGLISGAIPVNLGNDIEPLVFPGTIGTDNNGNTIGGADVDLYRIVVPDNGTLFVDIDTPFASDYVDSFLRLFDEEGNELFLASNGEPFESDDDLAFDINGNFNEFTDPNFPGLVFEDESDREFFQGHDTDSFLGVLVERGAVYYIGVSDFSNQDYNATNLNNRPAIAGGGQYQLITTFVNNDLNGSITQVSSNLPLSLPITGQRQTIGTDGDAEVGNRDVDIFRVNSQTAGILEIDIDSHTDSSITDPVDTVAMIFDASGNRLGVIDDIDSLDPLLQFQIAANTDYFVAVTGFGNDNFDPFALGSGSGGDTGEYILNSRLLPLNAINSLSNNTINSDGVRDITGNDFVVGNLGEDGGLIVGANDIDLYRFVPTTSGTVDIRVGANDEFSADTFLRLFDANGNEIAFNDDENIFTRGSFLRQEVIANREYFIGINGYSPNAGNYNPLTGEGAEPGSTGSYTLAINSETLV